MSQFSGVHRDHSYTLTASTVLFKANRRRAAQNPPLPPITREQILHTDLKNLLQESDYDLTTMVIPYSFLVTFITSIYWTE